MLEEIIEKIQYIFTELNISDIEIKKINYGYQIRISNNGFLRIYESKKGINYDFSQINNQKFIEELKIEMNNIGIEVISKVKRSNSIENKENIELEIIYPYLGTDESGKGDFFGPIVIAGVLINEENNTVLKKAGVIDSKKLSDTKIRELDKVIKMNCTLFDVVVIKNVKYNELYNKIGNLNKLLGWGHARVIENILMKQECNLIISDQFGNKATIESALMKYGKKTNLVQMHKAEQNIAVAAASIIARNKYIEELENMSRLYNFNFTKGTSSNTIELGKQFIGIFGEDKLKEVAKIHFKTSNNILE